MAPMLLTISAATAGLMPQFTVCRHFRLTRLTIAGCAVAFLLTACGGGGGGGDTTTAATSVSGSAAGQSAGTPTSPFVPTVLVAEDVTAFRLLNAERSRCGFGTLVRNSALDAAARAHADYQAFYGIVDHLENASTMPVGFSGALPIDRVLAKGYAARQIEIGGVADEITALIGSSVKTGLGEFGVRDLLNAPYHLRGLVSGYRDIGLAVRNNTDVGASKASVVLQINAAYLASAGPQLFPATEMHTYPCEGSTGVNFKLSNESPNPVPGRDLAVNPLGTTVLVTVRPGNRLVVTSSSFTEVGNGQVVNTRAPVGSANDPYRGCSEGCFTSSEAYIAADAPMLANTAYRVNLAGTNNGVPFTNAFTFTTGSGS